MKALAAVAPNKIGLIEQPEPIAARDSVVVAVAGCGVCGSDLPIYRGIQRVEEVGFFGHEFSGTIVSVGENVRDLCVGDRVASGLIRTCGHCEKCFAGHPNYCPDMKATLSPGGFAQFTRVLENSDFGFLTKIPDHVSWEQATLHEPLSCAIRIVEQAQVKLGDRVVVLGLGALGLLSALLAQKSGASMVAGVDIQPGRLALAAQLGIPAIDRTNFDIVIETTGSTSGFIDALSLARLGGRVVIGSVYHQMADGIDLRPIMRKELHVVGAKGPYPHLTAEQKSLAMELIVSGALPLDPLLRLYPIDQAQQAFEDTVAGKVGKAIVCFQEGDQ
ncbi:MAG: alcohol dehydrogenase catalytic domain-containing protein [Chloroflexi bacterium]|nr:alcohol dehydrogenase catalytic domain-containing protein [Chloroflexota bacterium]